MSGIELGCSYELGSGQTRIGVLTRPRKRLGTVMTMWAITFLLLHGPVAVQVALVCRIMMVCLASRLSLHWLTVPYVHSTKHIWCMMCRHWDDIRLLDVDVVCLVVILLDSHVIGIQVLLKFIVTCAWNDICNLPIPQLH